jgi:type IV pilus assembly protein PilB
MEHEVDMKDTHKKIGDILVSSGIITQAQLTQALDIQMAGKTEGRKFQKKRLGKILTELNYLTEDQLANALADQLDLPKLDPAEIDIPDSILQLVNRETAEANILIPYARNGMQLMIAMSNPLDLMAIDDLRFRTGMNIGAAVATETSILNAIEKCYKVEESVEDILLKDYDFHDIEFVKEEKDEEEAPQKLRQLSQAAPIVKLVRIILTDAIKRRATDIHIEPREKHVQIRYRVDGNLQDTIKLPKQTQASMVSRIKILGNMDIANHLTPQDGSTKMRYAKNSVDLRISTLPTLFGEKVVIRILDKNRGLQSLPNLGVPESLIKKLQNAGSKSQGMIVVTGPTGSGKTTTLYAFLQWLQDPAINIITVEDPVEYTIPGITQVPVKEQTGLDFTAFMKSALRQDPDIILVGEIRDLQTAEIAVRASLTGHLVLTTLHTNDTISTITRLIDLGIPPFLVSSSLSGIVAQRLVRRICENCKTELPYPDEDLPREFPRFQHVYKGRGCPQCDFTGFHGQVGVYEYLDVNNLVKRLIASNASEVSLREETMKMGMVSLFQDAWIKVASGVTTVMEVMGKVPYFDSSHAPAITLPASMEEALINQSELQAFDEFNSPMGWMDDNHIDFDMYRMDMEDKSVSNLKSRSD